MLPNGDDRTKGGKEQGNGSDLFFGDLDVTDLPASVFACDVPVEVFTDSVLKNEFEEMFVPFEATNFVYLRNFRRVRIYFETPLRAAQARIALHECIFKDQVIKIYFSQVKKDTSEESSDSLVPPQPERCFLISPPASPPVGWEPVVESEPVINYHLLSAIATLQPGKF